MDEYGKGWATGVHPDDVQRCLETHAISFSTLAESELDTVSAASMAHRGSSTMACPRFGSDGTFRGYIGSRPHHRRVSAESLHALTGRLIHAQEEERSRIARELHDDFSQRLALQMIDEFTEATTFRILPNVPSFSRS